METKRFEEYHKHGCNFYGKLVVVEYMEDLRKDPKYGTFGAEITFDYMAKAKKMVEEKGYDVKRVLLSIPEYVVEIQ